MIVPFSGHGTEDEGIVVHSDDGHGAVPLGAEVLSELLAIINDKLRSAWVCYR